MRTKSRQPPPEVLSQTEFRGAYRLVTFEDAEKGFLIVTFVPEGGLAEFKAAGNFVGSQRGERMQIRGAWREHAKYGWTFWVESCLPLQPVTEHGVAELLGSGLFKGVGPTTAKRIVDRFGEKALDVIGETPELLAEIKGITPAKARQISEDWEKHRASRDALLFMKEHGLSTAISMRLLRHYGDNAVGVLRQNPWRVGLEVKFIGFATADDIARRLGIPADSPDRTMAAFVHTLEMASFEGHTFLTRTQLLEKAVAFLRLEEGAVAPVLESAVAQGFVIRTAVEEEAECYFMPSLYGAETGVARMVAGLAAAARPLFGGDPDARIAEFEEKYRFRLAPQQQDAIRTIAGGGVCVVTGGPGTGKTTLVRALLHLVHGTDAAFALCSPTGRAAQRLSETTREEAATIHRLLKFNAQTGRFTHTHENPLPVELLIVDEASMLDIPLANALLRAVKRGSTVVFVGDVDQLPSVGPGSFLRDLIDSGRAKTVRLQVVFRQAEESMIIQNAHRINAGHSLASAEGRSAEKTDFFFVERDDPEQAKDAILRMVLERMPRRLKGDPAETVQVLAPMRGGPLGTLELNALLQARLNPGGRALLGGRNLREGDKVIQTSNNYDLNVYNGDVGRIVRRDAETGLTTVAFRRNRVAYTDEDLEELELAYAITIHKSQGSEYPGVVAIIHTSHFVMLKRNLLYTAVTRGKKLVVVVGSRRALYTAIRTATEHERQTALKAWLVRPELSGDLLGG